MQRALLGYWLERWWPQLIQRFGWCSGRSSTSCAPRQYLENMIDSAGPRSSGRKRSSVTLSFQWAWVFWRMPSSVVDGLALSIGCIVCWIAGLMSSVGCLLCWKAMLTSWDSCLFCWISGLTTFAGCLLSWISELTSFVGCPVCWIARLVSSLGCFLCRVAGLTSFVGCLSRQFWIYMLGCIPMWLFC